MGRCLEKIVGLFCILVIFGFLINHGMIDFSLVDKVTDKGKQILESDKAKEIGEEIKDISLDTAKTLADETGKRIKPALSDIRNKSKKDADNDENTDTETDDTLVEAELIRVVDGDTIIVDLGDGEDTRIRLIGIDTPESVNPDEEKNTENGITASNYTKSLLAEVNKVYLQFDEDETDQYGRTLAYVWLKLVKDTSSVRNIANYMLNGILVADGYAVDKSYAPNIMYADVFSTLREEAELDRRGLWND